MITKHKINLIRSLKNKNKRTEHQLFVVEGVKMVRELLESEIEVVEVFHTHEWQVAGSVKHNRDIFTQIPAKDLNRISQLTTPNQVLALARIPKQTHPIMNENLVLALDNIQDPGNLGTIIRTADWFGITQLVASPATADVYNPKVIQATMGSIFRVNIFYTELAYWLKHQHSKLNIPVYGAVLNGDSIYSTRLAQNGIIVLGNESKGITGHVMQTLTYKISIPTFNNQSGKAESLNVSIANAIICAEFRRQQNFSR